MMYWDASAVVPLLIEEPHTQQAMQWLAEDETIVTWALTATEIASAIERRARDGSCSPEKRRALLERLDTLAGAWDEVEELRPVRQRARALLAKYSLRAADALQLGAACLAAEDEPESLTFVCLDRRLADAASREGFRLRTIAG